MRPLLVAVAVLLLAPQVASAHAVLEDSAPGRGEQVERAPKLVKLRFDEPVEIAFGSVRVYDAAGERVDSGSTRHPDGHGSEVAVGLRNGLGDGNYTTTYRVVSADSHPVSGGFVFSVGEGGAAPRLGVDDLLQGGSAGPITEGAFGIVRALGYLAIALCAGGLVFVLAVWLPALRETAGPGAAPRSASEAFAARSRALMLVAAGVGALTAALGIVLQGATAGATSFWSAFDPDVVGDVLGTRFGTVWGLRLIAWLALGLLLALPWTRAAPAAAGVAGPAPGAGGLAPDAEGLAAGRDGGVAVAARRGGGVAVAPRPRPASPGAAILAPGAAGGTAGVGIAALLAAFICLTPALAGHSAVTDPALLVPANALHVVSMAIWVGGAATLVRALPAATRRLAPADRTPLLAAAIARFSTIAIFAVAALVASGVLQAIVQLEALSDLWESAFGRAILVKSGLVIVLVAIGAWNRERARPRLARLAAGGASPGRAGVLLRRALVAEVGLMVAVLGATAALASYAPPSGRSGPFSTSEELGPARVELTVDPARPGPNEIHVYLFDRRSGKQFDRVKELELDASLPGRGIGPLELRVEKAGPGHYVARQAQIAPAGDWKLELSARVSEFDAYTAELEVPVQ